MSLRRAARLLALALAFAGAACEDEHVELSGPDAPMPLYDAGIPLVDGAQAQLSPPRETR